MSPVPAAFLPICRPDVKGIVISSDNDDIYAAKFCLSFFLSCSSPSILITKSMSQKSCFSEVLYEPYTLADLNPGTLLRTLSIYSLTVFSTADLGILLPPADPDIMLFCILLS